MKIISYLLFGILGNILGLLAAGKIINGFMVSKDPREIIIAALILTGIDISIRPLIRVVASILILLTLGIFSIVINSVILYGLDLYLESITINTTFALALGAILISTINAIVQYVRRSL
ncbi:MAG: hypothetical protein COU08_00175 [Candidatus Harrisonbacteria bacterium CG10_big_fil_rev_8_21_14_0_10_42_17]|uniref:Phage holin family protein n=1 Tax=Candidatus Harrisonbacteria bacterium CG10_big_fil_rev_8_21_14_0_10_42_17 TaxID=1974584 RepID=A0A2M6WJ87_9BACT|nr:MAG: hypothetical protein COU08_00175 [Candidatus Harrisonbacteria bacterium CG10_big_fil_rev_8_21_14_0_10_42_17]